MCPSLITLFDTLFDSALAMRSDANPHRLENGFAFGMELEESPNVNAWAGIGFLFGTKSELPGTRHENDRIDKRSGAAGPAM
jgi:hypothetical protein